MEDFQYESKDTYLMNAKTGEIVGFHEIGWTEETEKGPQWVCQERWGNPYDKFLKFTGNSFRVFDDPKEEIAAMLNDGWVDLDTEKVNKFNALTKELLMHKYFYYEKDAPIISDWDYDMKERDWLKLGTELGLVMEEYPHWVGFSRNHWQAHDAIKMAEQKRVDQPIDN